MAGTFVESLLLADLRLSLIDPKQTSAPPESVAELLGTDGHLMSWIFIQMHIDLACMLAVR